MPGGLGHVSVAVSMLFAGISGSSSADATGRGKILIPAMTRQGYDARFAVAITACSPVMGVIIPSSVLIIVWGGVMSISIGALFLAVAILVMMIVGVLMATVFLCQDIRLLDRRPSHALQFLEGLRGARLAVLTLAFVIGGIVAGIVTPTKSAIIAASYSLILGMFV